MKSKNKKQISCYTNTKCCILKNKSFAFQQYNNEKRQNKIFKSLAITLRYTKCVYLPMISIYKKCYYQNHKLVLFHFFFLVVGTESIGVFTSDLKLY